MAEPTARIPDAAERRLRIILVHDYPPGVHAFELEKAFLGLGHRVFTVAMGGNTPGLDVPLLAMDPDYRYDLLTEPDTHVNDIVAAAGGGDLLLYLEPGRAYLPRDLEDCEIPTLGLLSEEGIHADWELPLYPMFDLGLTAWHSVQRRYRARGLDHVWQWYYGAAPVFIHNQHGERPEDFVFVGNLHPVIQRERNLVVQQITALAGEGFAIRLHGGLFFDRYNRALNRGKTTYAGSLTHQINMRVFESMAAGCLVIIPTPADAEDPLSRAFEPGREIVYADRVEDVLAAIRHYARDEDARRSITAAAERKVREVFQYRHVAERFVREIVPRIPADYRDRRAERLARAGDAPRTRRLNRARFGLGLGFAAHALAVMSQRMSQQPDAVWANALGVAHGLAGEFPEATTALAGAVDLEPTNPLYATNLACLVAHGMLLGDDPPSADLIDTVLELLDETDPAAVELGPDAFWYPYQYDRPRIEIARAITDLPVGPALSARLLDLMRFRLHSFAAAIHARLGDVAQAKTHLEAAAVILPDDGYTLDALGDVLTALDRSDEAADLHQRAAALEPFHTAPQIKVAHRMVLRGRPEDAARALRHLLDSTPSMDAVARAEAMALLGIAASQTGDLEGARLALENSLEIEADQPVVRRFLQQLPAADPQPV